MSISLLLTVFAAILFATSEGFSPGNSIVGRTQAVPSRSSPLVVRATQDIDSEAAFDAAIEKAGDKLVVVDYSTTWCGPCKVIAPKFEELSESFADSVFLKVIGDSSAEASKLMKREGVRSVPSFHYFKNGKKVEVVNGANPEAIEGAIKKHA